MSARDDYPLVNNSGAYQWHQMCDEIDSLRAQVERDRPVIEAAQDVLDTKPGGVWHREALRQLRVAMSALAACAPDEVNEEQHMMTGVWPSTAGEGTVALDGTSTPDEVNDTEEPDD